MSLSEGYGQVYWNGFGGRAHRVSYQVFVGPISAGAQVQHKCDRKDCINPKHLYLGTQAQNVADHFSRGEPNLTPHEFERLCNKLADLERKAEVTDHRRKQIEAQLRRTISDRRSERSALIKKHRTAMRLQRRALAEEREQERKEQRAERLSRRSPEALAKLKASIAQLKEIAPEELKADHAAEVAKRKRSDPRRWRNGSGNQQRT